MQLEERQRKRLRPSARVKWGNYSFNVEPFSELSGEALKYIDEHYNEAGTYADEVPLDIDWAALFEYERRGQLRCFSVRDTERLLGYALYILTPTLHAKGTLHALSDAIFVAKQYRNGYMPVKFMRYIEEQLKLAGAKVVYHYVKPNGTGKIFERLGALKAEELYVRLLK